MLLQVIPLFDTQFGFRHFNPRANWVRGFVLVRHALVMTEVGYLIVYSVCGSGLTAIYAPPLSRVHWVRPEMLVEVTFVEWTPDGLQRYPSRSGVGKGASCG